MPRQFTFAACCSILAFVAFGAVEFPSKPDDLSTPVQQRIAIIGPNDVSIGWDTYEKQDKPCVHYGTSKGNLTSEECSDSSVTYPTSRTWSQFVLLKDLKPGTTYYYEIESGNSSTQSFTSPRPAGDATPFTMGVVIDLGAYGADGSFDIESRDLIRMAEPAPDHSTIGRLVDTLDDYEFIIHPGDLAYADDWYVRSANREEGEVAYEAVLETFYDQLAPVASRKPYMASPGNHEAACGWNQDECPLGQSNFTDFMNRFGTMPTAFASTSSHAEAKANATIAQKLAKPPFWYSFEYGMAHIVMFDTETDFPDAPEQYSARVKSGPFGAEGQQLDFLKADFASVDRTITPWLIVAAHRPLYSVDGGGICQPCKKAFEPLFYQYGVDLAIFGHVHNSQRFLPIYDGKTDPAGMDNPKAPMYIVAGGAGNIEGMSKVRNNATGNAFENGDDYAFAKILFKDPNHMQVDFVKSSTGEILDTSVLYKEHADRFVVEDAKDLSSASNSLLVPTSMFVILLLAMTV